LDEASKKFTAFVTPWGVYEFNVVPFGILNSPGEFQKAMDELFEGLNMNGVLLYIDDIVIYADSKKGVIAEVGTSTQALC
jgi:hypothetical protein